MLITCFLPAAAAWTAGMRVPAQSIVRSNVHGLAMAAAPAPVMEGVSALLQTPSAAATINCHHPSNQHPWRNPARNDDPMHD